MVLTTTASLANPFSTMRSGSGAAVTVGELQGITGGASWGDDGNIIVGTSNGLLRLPAAGGTAQPLPDVSGIAVFPDVLPGSRAILFNTGRALASLDDLDISVVSLDSGEMKTLVHGGYWPRYAKTTDGAEYLVYVRAGTLTLHARRLGFQPKTVTGLMLADGQVLQQDITLAEASIRLEAAVVTAERERGSVSAALDAQKHAAGVVNAVTSEQISRSPDSDAAQAVQRVSGVTVQDGKYVFVRGLGERYTTTTLNGARIPSPEPERKVVPLDLFPSGLLQSVTTSKTFTPDQSGDFSGAAVEIRTREYPAERQLTWSATLGHATRPEGVFAAPTAGGEPFAMVGTRRALPTIAGDNVTFAPAATTRAVGAFVSVGGTGGRVLSK